MDIAVKTTSYNVDDNSWLGSADGTSATDTITLDVSTFTAGTHYPDGYLKSGLPLGKITATGLYGLYSDAAVDGRTTCVGFLYGGVTVNSTNPTTTKIGAALLWRGEVRLSKLPITLDANGQADLAAKFRLV